MQGNKAQKKRDYWYFVCSGKEFWNQPNGDIFVLWDIMQLLKKMN